MRRSVRPYLRPAFLVPAFFVVLVAAGWTGTGRAAELEEARRLELDNGMRVLLLRDAAYPVVAVQMLYDVGARNETTGITGISHFVEHMLFRGTERFPLADITGVIERAGGEWHGYTLLDQTTFYEAAPRELLPTLLRLEAERMTSPRMAADEVDPERGAVVQELRGYQLDARSELYDAMMATLFLEHPYRNNTMGWESDLMAIDHDDLVAYDRRYYGPRNAILAVVGDIDLDRVETEVRDLYQPIPPRGDATSIRTVEPPLTGARRIVIRRPGAAPALMVSFQAPPPARPREYAALLLLDAVVGGAKGLGFRQYSGESAGGDDVDPGSRLDAARPASAAARFGTSLLPTRYPYQYSIFADPAPGHTPAEVEPLIFAVLSGVADRLPAAEVDSARGRVLDRLPAETDSPVGLAHELAFWTGLGGIEVRRAIIDALGSVGPEEVRRLARGLTPDHAVVGIVLPDGAPARAAGAGAAGGAATEGEAGGASPGAAAREAAAGRGGGRASRAGRSRALRPARTAAVKSETPTSGVRAILDSRPGEATFALKAAAAYPGHGRFGDAAAARLRGAAAALGNDTATRAALIDAGARCDLSGPGEAGFAERDTLQVVCDGPAAALPGTIALLGPALARALDDAAPIEAGTAEDPAGRALQELQRGLGDTEAGGAAGGDSATPSGRAATSPAGGPALALAIVSPFSERAVAPLLHVFRAPRPGPASAPPSGTAAGAGPVAPFPAGLRTIRMADISQGRLFFAFPGGDDPDTLRALGWILHHDYSGRLGAQAIARMGLVYEMDSEVVTRGRPLFYVTMGADPGSLEALRGALEQVLDETAATLTEAEVAAYRSFARGDLPVRLSDPRKAAAIWCAALLRGEDERGPAQAAERAAALTRDRVAALARAVLPGAGRLTVVVTREDGAPVGGGKAAARSPR